MADFGFLKELDVEADDTAELTMMSIRLPNGKNPVLIGKLAGEVNKPYATAVARKALKQQKGARGASVSPEVAVTMAGKNRDDDRALFAQHVITGWRDVCDHSGAAVDFSKDSCLDFFNALPDDFFDQIRGFFADPANFRETVSEGEARDEGNV